MSQNIDIQSLLDRAGCLPLNGGFYDLRKAYQFNIANEYNAERVQDIIKSTHDGNTNVFAEVLHTELNNAGFELYAAENGTHHQLWLIATDDEIDHITLLIVSVRA